MKRFRFQLEPVLNFKQQTLDALLVELDMIHGRVLSQEWKQDEAFQRVADYAEKYSRKKQEGLTVTEALEFESCQQVLQQRARREDEELRKLRREEENKREEVIEARKDTHSLEKLKDLRRSEYDTAAAKAEEKALDDLTAARRAAAV